MSDWTSGYVADIGYTFSYHAELNPLRGRLAFLNAGLAFPQIRTACDLGFGQGMSVNIHAAAAPVAWYGTDFIPDHAVFARDLAEASGAQLLDEAFADYCRRPDLPDFDFIGLHGTWSWISAENRAVIVDFLRRKLKVGGVFYVGYNTLPGWAPMMPMRHLLTRHAETMSAPGLGTAGRIDASLAFMGQLLATHPAFGAATPQAADTFAQMTRQNRNYLAHEYYNRDWMPVHFAEMADSLSAARLSYACSAGWFDHVDDISLTPGQQSLLRELPDPLFRQSVRDFMVNRQFRRDYWVKGARRLSESDRRDRIRELGVILVTPRDRVSLRLAGKSPSADGGTALREEVYAPILDMLADHRPKTLGELEQAVKGREIGLEAVVETVIVLAGKGDVATVQDEAAIAAARPSSDRLNRLLMQRARGTKDLDTLASPVTGGGVEVNRFEQMFLAARAEGRTLPAEWAACAWEVLSGLGETLVLGDEVLRTAQDNMAELTLQARSLAERRLPILQALGVA